MSAVPVADTISEIMERLPSLSGFGRNITENIKRHLTDIKGNCSGPAKLDLSHAKTRKWVGDVIDLLYSVDDLSADVVLLLKRSRIASAFKCNLKLLLQLRQIEKQLLFLVKSMKEVKMLPNQNAEEEEKEEDYVKEMENILEKKGDLVRAVVIFGIKGMRKTESAKHVWEDEKVKSRFDVVMCIDGLDLEGYYAQSVMDRVNHELEEEKKKKKSGEGKGFFVVLNNFQNNDHTEWLKLAEKLKEVAVTSCEVGVLLVTTVELAVARFVGSSFEQTRFLFDWLSPSASRRPSVFLRIAEAIESLLKMCVEDDGGAIETMARLFRSRKPITDSDINQLKDEFVQEMQLKYYNMFGLHDWHQRQCFAYSLFILLSSQTCVKREKLIRLWMAEGFLRHSSSKEPEDLGHECIEKFLNSPSPMFLMQDGEICIDYKKAADVRGMAEVMLGKHSVYVEEKAKIDNDVRRVLLNSDLGVSKGTPPFLFETNKNVRTFLLEKQSRPPNQVMLSWLACDEILLELQRLRVLVLKDLGIKVLPDSIENLKSLRYLDLSHNNLKKLPICVGKLQHLQTLLLSHCFMLMQLPDDVNHFPSLRHLDLDQCLNLTHMPSVLGNLNWLRSLPHFVTSDRNGLAELLPLNELRGDLEISHLERFKVKASHRALYYLKEKQHLERLTLRWNHDDEDVATMHSPEEDDQNRQVLIQLKPHSNLKRLSVVGYRGDIFVDWLSSLNNVVEISLYNCPNCKSLPTLDGVLVNLERLTLMNLDSLQFVTETDKDNGCKKLLLKRVKISDCPNLVSWWKPGTKNATVFSGMSELVVEYCPKLVSMPPFPTIDNKLVLDNSNMKPLLNTLRYNSTGSDSSPLSKLKQLTIINVDEKQYPPEEEWLKNFTSLEKLDIRDCKALKSIKGWKYLGSLEILHISNCTDIDLPNEEWQGMKKLNYLIIEDMSDLKSLPQGMKHFQCLDNLEIKGCPELTTVPEDIVKIFGLFSFIVIEDCPKLPSLPRGMIEVFGLTIRNCPLLAAWRKSISKFPKLLQAPSMQETDEEETNSEAESSNPRPPMQAPNF
ncbi:putative disease resistance protein RGA4, partial [Mucuna pruriens]